MKGSFQKKIAVGILGFGLGAGAMFGIQDHSRDPFIEMRERMLKNLDHPDAVAEREDDQFVYYDVAIPGFDKNKLDVKVEDGQIEISGQAEKQSQDEFFGILNAE